MLVNIASGPRAVPEALVDLLLECHARIRRFTALAHAAGTRTDATPQEIADACEQVRRYFSEALPLHVADEELSIEPRLRGLRPEVDGALAEMARQHTGHAPLLAGLLDACALLAQHPGDALARAHVVEAASALDAAFSPHLALEERVILPAVGSLLPADVQREIIAELRARRTPQSIVPGGQRHEPQP